MARTPDDDRRIDVSRFVLGAMGCASDEELAQQLGVSERTVRRWYTRPKILKRLEQATDKLLAEFIRLTARDCAKAHKALVELLDDPSPHVRLSAAKAIVADMLKIAELRIALATKTPPAADGTTPTETLDEAWNGVQSMFERNLALPPPIEPPTNGHAANGNGHAPHE